MTVHVWRWMTLVGSGFAALALLLPFASFPVLGSIDGIGATAWPALLPLAAVGVVAVNGSRHQGLGTIGVIAVVVATAAAVLYAAVKLVDAVLAVRATSGATLGSGGFVLLGGTLFTLVGAAAAVRA